MKQNIGRSKRTKNRTVPATNNKKFQFQPSAFITRSVTVETLQISVNTNLLNIILYVSTTLKAQKRFSFISIMQIVSEQRTKNLKGTLKLSCHLN